MVSGKICLRPYCADDLDAVIEVFQTAIRQVASRDYGPAQVVAWSAVDRDGWRQARLAHPTWVAVLGDKIVGFCDLEDDGHLDMMFVHGNYQGLGVASMLVAAIEAAAIVQGRARLFTEASLTARPFFEKRGFVVEAQQAVTKRGETFVNFRMFKILAAG
jgi:putative acetyltransferase